VKDKQQTLKPLKGGDAYRKWTIGKDLWTPGKDRLIEKSKKEKKDEKN